MKKQNFIGTWCAAMALALASGIWAGDQCGMDGAAAAPSGSAVKNMAIKTGANQPENFPEISQAALIKMVADKSAFIVDANSSESYAEGRIPGATHFDGDANSFSGPLPKNKDAFIVAYCGGPGCQAWCGAASALKKMGYTNIHHYKGGINGWKTAGLRMDKSAG